MPGNHVHVIDVNGQRDSCDVNQVDSCHVKRWPWSTSFITLMSHEWSTCFTSRQSRACPSVLTGPRPCCCRLRAIAPRAYGTRAARCLFSTSFRSCVPCPCALLLLPCPFLPHSLRLTASLPLFPSGQRSGATVVLLHHCLQGCNSDHSSMDARTGAFKHGDVGALFARRILCLDGKRRLLCQGEKSRV